MESYTIGGAAKAAGVTTRAVRLYESKGLVPMPDRSESGYRLFTDEDVQVLTFIRQGRSLGLSLDAIAEILRLSEDGAPCEHTEALLAQRLTEIDAAIADLQRLRTTILKAKDGAGRHSPAARCAVIERASDPN